VYERFCNERLLGTYPLGRAPRLKLVLCLCVVSLASCVLLFAGKRPKLKSCWTMLKARFRSRRLPSQVASEPVAQQTAPLEQQAEPVQDQAAPVQEPAVRSRPLRRLRSRRLGASGGAAAGYRGAGR
jgi:hypothetical protein